MDRALLNAQLDRLETNVRNLRAGANRKKPAPNPLNIPEIIRQLTTGPVQGLQRDLLAAHADRHGLLFDANRPTIPFTRSPNTVGVAGQGGFLIDTKAAGLLDSLRPWSVTASAGITVMQGLESNMSLPRVEGNASANWLQTEATAEAPTNWQIGQTNFTPKTVSSTMSWSRLLNLQSPQSGLYVHRELQKTTATALDTAVLAGSGIAGQPLGIVNTPGITSTPMSSTTYGNVLGLKESVAALNTIDGALAFVASPATRALLENRQRFSGSNSAIWDDDQDGPVAGKSAYVTSTAPASTLICADWSQVALAIWGAGYQIAIDPYSAFTQGVYTMSVTLVCDVAILHPQAVAVGTSIS
jgi:HK97 family phage major capsid protein